MTTYNYFSAAADQAAVVKLEAILRDCNCQEADRHPRSGQLPSSPADGTSLVFSLSDTLVEALVAAAPVDLARTAEPWSLTVELQQCQVDARTALGALEALAGLARGAGAAGFRPYCQWTL
ncbi:hypothetical protein ACFV6F_16260 [Kitasatospora phosalacinea]|uniref:hypothetical protein n=1 Tax=Kitasatospora phosalacinea TaxID=2065 RepID=UPI0036522139